MAKHLPHAKPSTLAIDRCLFITITGAILILCALSTFTGSWPSFSTLIYKPNPKDCPQGSQVPNMNQESTHETFCDDQGVDYTLSRPVINWDSKRKEWLKRHPSFTTGVENRVLVLTGSHPSPCQNSIGDHLLLRFFKNKVDYCRLHGYDVFYNNAFLDPKMRSFWAKIPIVRASMLAHPEIEWMFWVDSDAVFTDMEFKIPLERYKDHNLVVHGWPNLIYEKRSWVAVNAGVFLLRNCQWSMDLLDVWASMGPRSPNYQKWGKILQSVLKDKTFPESDDQSSLIYLLLKEKKKLGDMVYIENEYYLSGYWLEIVGKLDNVTGDHVKINERVRRRHAEVVSESYVANREMRRRPFITHFTGCQPCSGDHNPAYVGNSCLMGMERALNFADNQVLRSYGFMHPDIGNGSYVEPVPVDLDVDEI